MIYLVRTQNFPEDKHFLPSDKHTCKSFEKFCVQTKWMIPKKKYISGKQDALLRWP